MISTKAEVLAAARALTRPERAEIAQSLISSLETSNEIDEARYADLYAAVAIGVCSLETGNYIDLAVDTLDDYLHERGRLATECVAEEIV